MLNSQPWHIFPIFPLSRYLTSRNTMRSELILLCPFPVCICNYVVKAADYIFNVVLHCTGGAWMKQTGWTTQILSGKHLLDRLFPFIVHYVYMLHIYGCPIKWSKMENERNIMHITSSSTLFTCFSWWKVLVWRCGYMADCLHPPAHTQASLKGCLYKRN